MTEILQQKNCAARPYSLSDKKTELGLIYFMFQRCLIIQKNIIPAYNKNVYMALKRCPFPHEYVEDEDYIEVKNESIYESNRALFEEIIRECFEPLKKYNLETELKFFK